MISLASHIESFQDTIILSNTLENEAFPSRKFPGSFEHGNIFSIPGGLVFTDGIEIGFLRWKYHVKLSA